jgi:hypothetical protein
MTRMALDQRSTFGGVTKASVFLCEGGGWESM